MPKKLKPIKGAKKDVVFNNNNDEQDGKSSFINKLPKVKNKEKIVILDDNDIDDNDKKHNNDIILNNNIRGKNQKSLLPLKSEDFEAKLRKRIEEFKQYIQGCAVSDITKAYFLKFEDLFNGLYQSFIKWCNDKNMASINTTAFIEQLVMPFVQNNLSSVGNREEAKKQIDSIKQQLNESAKTFLDNFTAIDNNEKFHEQFYNFIDNVISVLRTCVYSVEKIMSINILHRNIEPIIENEDNTNNLQIEEEKIDNKDVKQAGYIETFKAKQENNNNRSQSAQHQQTKLPLLDNNIEQDNRKENNQIYNEEIQNNNVEQNNLNENINNQQEMQNDEEYCQNIINNVVNQGTLPENTNLQRFIDYYHQNNNILTHKSAIFWLNAEERRNNALLDFINNDNVNNNLQTLNQRLANIRGGKCSWCGGDY